MVVEDELRDILQSGMIGQKGQMIPVRPAMHHDQRRLLGYAAIVHAQLRPQYLDEKLDITHAYPHAWLSQKLARRRCGARPPARRSPW